MISIKTPIIDTLLNYSKDDILRLHMPGHKGRIKENKLLKTIKDNLFSIDLTEVNGTDNLYSANGIIKESQEITAKYLGASESFYLVNGSTAGVYSMILSGIDKGDKIIVQRNCHKSVFMAAFLGGLRMEYIIPDVIDDFSFAASLCLDNIKTVVEKNKDAKAIVITSPSYYGTCCDVKAISEIAKKHNMLLLVDAAHGAHFAFGDNMPKTSISTGADIEVTSTHKTLPSLTQTGILNVSKEGINKINIEKLKFMLSVYQSSSPSYVFMSSIEAGVNIMNLEGQELLEKVEKYINNFKKNISSSQFYKVLDSSYIGKNSIFDIDPTRLVISSKIGGAKLSEILRNEYLIQVEMADNKNIVIIGTVFDEENDYQRLYEALMKIENEYKQIEYEDVFKSKFLDYSYKAYFNIEEAYSHSKEKVLINESEGRICGEIIAPYPPGVPIILPGEIITKEKITCMKTCQELGIEVNGIEGDYIKILIN